MERIATTVYVALVVLVIVVAVTRILIRAPFKRGRARSP